MIREVNTILEIYEHKIKEQLVSDVLYSEQFEEFREWFNEYWNTTITTMHTIWGVVDMYWDNMPEEEKLKYIRDHLKME